MARLRTSLPAIREPQPLPDQHLLLHFFVPRRASRRCDWGTRSLQNQYEHQQSDAGRLGRPQIDPPRTERPRPVPLVFARGATRPLYLLLRVLRPRVETAHATCISSRKGIRARSRRLRALRRGYAERSAQAAFCTRVETRLIARILGLAAQIAQKSVGCRPHSSGDRGRWRMRSCEHSHALFTLPSPGDRRVAAAHQKPNPICALGEIKPHRRWPRKPSPTPSHPTVYREFSLMVKGYALRNSVERCRDT